MASTKSHRGNSTLVLVVWEFTDFKWSCWKWVNWGHSSIWFQTKGSEKQLWANFQFEIYGNRRCFFNSFGLWKCDRANDPLREVSEAILILMHVKILVLSQLFACNKIVGIPSETIRRMEKLNTWGMSNWTLHVRWWVRDTPCPHLLCKENKRRFTTNVRLNIK